MDRDQVILDWRCAFAVKRQGIFQTTLLLELLFG